MSSPFATVDACLKSGLICVAVIERLDDAVPLTEALVAGGLSCIEITFRTECAADAITAIRKALPKVCVGAGTLLTPDHVARAKDAGAMFGVSPGLSEAVSGAAKQNQLRLFPGVITPTEVMRALELGWRELKFFPAETAGGVGALKALAGPFTHTGVRFIPTGGITEAVAALYLAMPQVAAVGGTWMADRKLVLEKNWSKITALTAAAMKAARSARA